MSIPMLWKSPSLSEESLRMNLSEISRGETEALSFIHKVHCAINLDTALKPVSLWYRRSRYEDVGELESVKDVLLLDHWQTYLCEQE